ncbi:hypothetical protein [Kitasatospora viridis]|uniref:Uncharacterized protein n=1 Tax=Kitasatospora viridis TaxID=281105 RepID=A0A561S9R3_9ACTN|nr:hypothetical protein [Kitasatospora viridis]TWF71611.1 hypothetical protein FHX73_19241 [Kitasatospora viridis]
MDIEALRAELHQAVDEIVDRHLGRTAATGEAPDPVSVTEGEQTGEWTYQWPGGGVEKFHRTRWFEAAGDRGRHRVRVAWARRPAWGREDRLRAIVFLQQGKPESKTYYPLTEFVETDDDRFAAIIPRPTRPRAQLRDDEPLPERFRHQVVERTDALFESIADGSSVRLVLEESAEDEMVRHGYWVAALRNRF